MSEPRLIDANALMGQVSIKTSKVAQLRYTEGFNDAIMRVRSMIHSAPTIDAVEIVHGRWIEHVHVDEFGDCVYIDHECSKCHVTEHFQDDVRAFCPNCGAKMDGGAEG